MDVKYDLTTWVTCCCSLPVTLNFMIMCLGIHILCNVNLVWMCVFQLRSNGCYLWKRVINMWISIYVRFLLHMCVVNILMVVTSLELQYVFDNWLVFNCLLVFMGYLLTWTIQIITFLLNMFELDIFISIIYDD
jgi:hypothetical protein